MKEETKQKIKDEIVEWVKIIATALVLSFVITQFVRPTLVKGESMYPTLKENDYLIVNRISHRIGGFDNGDIIVFSTNLVADDGKSTKDLVKRVIGTEGDSIKIENSMVYVNGEVIEEVYIGENQTYPNVNEITLQEGELFVMGDNREKSLDSRHLDVGVINEKDVMGKVLVRLFPFNSIGFVE